MYIKKSVLIVSAIVLIIATATLTIGIVNPFGFTAWGEFFQFSVISRLIQGKYYEDVDKETIANTAIEGVAVATGDPYTRYLWGESAKEYMEDIAGNYCGIGIYIENDANDNTISIVSPIAGTPAEEAGLVTGDKILAVNGTSFTGQEINDAVAQMRGEEGTAVTITVLRKSTGETEDIELTRKEIEIPSVESEMLTDTVACIRITQFTTNTSDLFLEAYTKHQNEGMKKLILDLRNNPGGLMMEAAEIANMFIEDEKVIVYTLDKDENRVNYPATGPAESIPMVVLTNQGSASASEVLTGALKDYDIAHHIGEKTYGKGVVQGVYETGKDSVLSVTIARYYTPNGVCIHGDGIEPDEVVSMDVEKYVRLSELALNEDEQMQRALAYFER